MISLPGYKLNWWYGTLTCMQTRKIPMRPPRLGLRSMLGLWPYLADYAFKAFILCCAQYLFCFTYINDLDIGTPQKKEFFLCAETPAAARAWVATVRWATSRRIVSHLRTLRMHTFIMWGLILSIAHCAPQQPSSTLSFTDIYPVKSQNVLESKKDKFRSNNQVHIVYNCMVRFFYAISMWFYEGLFIWFQI